MSEVLLSSTHIWHLPRLPVSLSDEAGESAIRMDMRMARVSSTQAAAAAIDVAKNNLYRVLHPHKGKRGTATFWTSGASMFLTLRTRVLSEFGMILLYWFWAFFWILPFPQHQKGSNH